MSVTRPVTTEIPIPWDRFREALVEVPVLLTRQPFRWAIATTADWRLSLLGGIWRLRGSVAASRRRLAPHANHLCRSPHASASRARDEARPWL